MVTLRLTPKQAQLLYVHIPPSNDTDHTLQGNTVNSTADTISFSIDPVLLESLRYTAIMRASPTLKMHEWATWKEIVYITTDALVAHRMGIPARKIA